MDVSTRALDPVVGADQSQSQPPASALSCSGGSCLQWSSWKHMAKWALPSPQPWTSAGWQSERSPGSSAGVAGGRRDPAAGCCWSMMWVTDAWARPAQGLSQGSIGSPAGIFKFCRVLLGLHSPINMGQGSWGKRGLGTALNYISQAVCGFSNWEVQTVWMQS